MGRIVKAISAVLLCLVGAAFNSTWYVVYQRAATGPRQIEYNVNIIPRAKERSKLPKKPW